MSYRAQRLAALALLVIFLPSVAMATAYALRPVHPSLAVYAIDKHEHVLAPGSRLSPGQHITVVAKGFRPRARVQVVDVSRRRIVFVHADSNGVARRPFVVPGRRAEHLSVALDGPGGGRTTSTPSRGALPRAHDDPQTVTVTVPVLRRFPYRIAGGAGVQGVGVGVGPGTHTGGGGLAATGDNVLALLAAGLLLVILGAIIWRGSRGRTGSDSPEPPRAG